MSKSAQIRARTEHRQAIPFEVALPNAETRAAIEEAREGGGLTAGSAEELFAALDEG